MFASPTLTHPLVLCISGHDPGGGAGIQADIETVTALGGQALTAITSLTVQDSSNLHRAQAVEAEFLDAQLCCLLNDSSPCALKLGLVGGIAQLPVITSTIERARVPVVCDPVLAAGGGKDFETASFIDEFRHSLFPLVTVLTPNAAEARRLVPSAKSLDDCGAALLAAGCANVLITGGDEPGMEVVNIWCPQNAPPVRFTWSRLPQTFHGAGCTLATAIAVGLARGLEMRSALEEAQFWTYRSLEAAIATGRGRRIPLRRKPTDPRQ